MACSTCHVIVDPAWADKLPDASEEEEDMLDLAFDVRPTSRLGCQLTISQDFDGLVVSLPAQHLSDARQRCDAAAQDEQSGVPG